MGKVFLIGAGPGDQDLITVKGLKLLKSCDVVLYDRLIAGELLKNVKKDCKKVYVGKKAGMHHMPQEEINKLLIQYANSYDVVVRLKGGDPFVFGRGGEEVSELIRNHIPFEVIPGISSAMAVPLSAGIPVTNRGISQSVHIITGHRKEGEGISSEQYEVLSKLDGTLVFLMGLSSIKKIVGNLLYYGKPRNTAVAVISNGTTKKQKTVRGNLDTIVRLVERENLSPPAVIIIGEVARLNYQSIETIFTQYKIGLIGTEVIRNKLRRELQAEGIQIIDLCNMKIVKTAYDSQLIKEVKDMDAYDWIVFTSQNAIRLFFNMVEENQIDLKHFNQIKFAVIGSGSQEELMKHGYFADFIPSKYNAREFALEFSKVVHKNEKVLIPRAKRGSKELLEILSENQIVFNEFPFYDVVGEFFNNINFDMNSEVNQINCFVFASASGVEAFFEEMKKNNLKLANNKIACIGDITAAAIKEAGYDVDIIANEYTVKALAKELKSYYGI